MLMRLLSTLAGTTVLAMALMGSAHAQPKQQVNVAMPLFPAGSDAAIYLGMEKGWFAEAGMELHLEDGRGSNHAMQVVAAGQADIGHGVLVSMVAAKEKGAKLISIAGWSRRTELSVFVDADSKIGSLRDMKGMKIGLLANSPFVPILDPLFRNVGMKKEDVQLIYVEPAALFAQYSAKQMDGMMSIGPYVLPIVNPRRPSKTFNIDEYGIVSPGSGTFVSEKVLGEKKDMLVRYVSVLMRAWQYIYSGHEEEAVKAIIAQNPHAKLNAVILKGQVENYRSYILTDATKDKPIGWQSVDQWAVALKLLQEGGVVKAGREPSYFMTNEIVDAATKRLQASAK